MEYKITKVRKYGKGIYQSEKIGTQYYNVVYAHLFTKNDTNHIHPIKVHFIHMFDRQDLREHFNYDDEEETKQTFTQTDIKECRDKFIWAAAESLFYSNDLKQIVKDCNYTIERYA